jgi:archaellum component FlaG (FlaF/FlaG flagellin family)
MKKGLLAFGILLSSVSTIAQQQIGNGGFETWGTVSSGQEPTNWNSFLSAGGALSSFAGDQLQSSTDVRPGSSGTNSALLFSNSTLGIIANGNLTLGKINMGSATPASTSNYNSSIITDVNFSEAYTDTPDSIVFWAKFVPASGNTTDSARISAIIHDNYAFRDPIDAPSQAYVVATAIKNFSKTNGSWVRMSVPFTYSLVNIPAFILITFTTNKTPGGGSDNDQLWIDDVELKNGGAGISTNENSAIQVLINNGSLSLSNQENEEGVIEIFDLQGKKVNSGTLEDNFDVSNMHQFIVRIQTNKGAFSKLFTQN